jgi:hypothetical protein
VVDSLRNLIQPNESWPRPDEAAKGRAKLPETIAAEE